AGLDPGSTVSGVDTDALFAGTGTLVSTSQPNELILGLAAVNASSEGFSDRPAYFDHIKDSFSGPYLSFDSSLAVAPSGTPVEYQVSLKNSANLVVVIAAAFLPRGNTLTGIGGNTGAFCATEGTFDPTTQENPSSLVTSDFIGV